MNAPKGKTFSREGVHLSWPKAALAAAGFMVLGLTFNVQGAIEELLAGVNANAGVAAGAMLDTREACREALKATQAMQFQMQPSAPLISEIDANPVNNDAVGIEMPEILPFSGE